MYICIYVYIYVYMYIGTEVYIYRYIHICLYVQMYRCRDVYMCIYVHMYIWKFIREQELWFLFFDVPCSVFLGTTQFLVGSRSLLHSLSADCPSVTVLLWGSPVIIDTKGNQG